MCCKLINNFLVVCGGGYMNRRRHCITDAAFCSTNEIHPACNCSGEPILTTECALVTCAAWASWTPWTPCTVSCANGTQSRKRTCKANPTQCAGNAASTPDCLCDGRT